MDNTSVRLMVVTPEIATQWLASYNYDHQRPISSLHVRFLAEEMRRGAFKQDTTIEISSTSEKKYLTDGRHRLTALVSANVSQRFVVVNRILPNEDDIAKDYTRTDKGRRRTITDDYRVLDLTLELGLTSTQLNKFGAAIALILDNFRQVKQGGLHPDDRLRVMREYADSCGAYLEITAGCKQEIRAGVNRAATMAVALVTYQYSSRVHGIAKVDEFWRGAVFDDGLRIGDARKLAHEHMLFAGMSGGYYGMKFREIVTPSYSSRYIATCFNEYVAGHPRKQISIPKDKVFDPIKIDGYSPFNGK